MLRAESTLALACLGRAKNKHRPQQHWRWRLIVDADLAQLYGTTTTALNQAVKRNAGRFPGDFRFQLTATEKREVVTNCDHLGRLKFSAALPCAFTEHGAIMAAGVLSTPRAIDVSVYVVRAFVKLRQWLGSHKELAGKLLQRIKDHIASSLSIDQDSFNEVPFGQMGGLGRAYELFADELNERLTA